MNLDYSRLSRDEDKVHYTSIENQRKIIQRYAKEKGIRIDKSFEDDGYSGYTMDRPAFNEIMHLIDENRVDVLIAKDLSRLGRHNANVLLFLERAKVHGVRIILVDDNYDSATDSDDMIGIKTWINERHVVEGSRKVRNALSIMQETAALVGQVPFGYIKDPFIKNKYSVEPNAALTVKKIFELYADGYGYMRIAKKLTDLKLPTPNMVLAQYRAEKGLSSKRPTNEVWTADMIKRTIVNDFYIGTLRTKKNETIGINGVKKRLSKEQHHVFEDAHEPIISKDLFYFVQNLNRKRGTENTYKGERKFINEYAGLLECGDCGRSLTINNYGHEGITSYACKNYREKGKDFCSAHSIKRDELNLIVRDYLQLCREVLKEMIGSLDSIIMEEVKQSSGMENRLRVLEKNVENAKLELKAIMERKIKDIMQNPSMEDMIAEMYDKMQMEKMLSIETMQTQMKEFENIDKSKSEIKKNFKSALEVFDNILKSKEFTNRQLNILIDKIIVYEDSTIEIKLNGELGSIFKDDVLIRMSKEDRIKRVVIDYITKVSTFGITKLISEVRKTDSISRDNMVKILDQFVEKGFVVLSQSNKSGNGAIPYCCVATKEEMLDGFEICTDLVCIDRITNLGAGFETINRISIWIQRYM